MILRFVVLLAVGRLLMFMLRKFPPATKVAEKIHFKIECDLCFGFWTYLGLNLYFGIRLLDGLVNYSYIPIFDEVVTAAFATFVAHLVTVGWKNEFGVFEVG